MDINAFLEPFQQAGQHFGGQFGQQVQHVGEQFQQAPEQARQYIEQRVPAAPQIPAPRTGILGS